MGCITLIQASDITSGVYLRVVEPASLLQFLLVRLLLEYLGKCSLIFYFLLVSVGVLAKLGY